MVAVAFGFDYRITVDVFSDKIWILVAHHRSGFDAVTF